MTMSLSQSRAALLRAIDYKNALEQLSEGAAR